MRVLRYLPGVATLELDDDACIGCGRCVEVCPHGVFTTEDNKAQLVDIDACMECGACIRNCPVSALSNAAGDGCGCATGVLFGAFSADGDGACCHTKGECC
jgi:NAD-dependent dihydropyrimidine dehydrogenase PreA subunit